MSATTTQDVIYRTLTDESFLTEFRADPEAALEEYDLSDEEMDVLTSGDDMGVHGLGEEALTATIWVAVYVY